MKDPRYVNPYDLGDVGDLHNFVFKRGEPSFHNMDVIVPDAEYQAYIDLLNIAKEFLAICNGYDHTVGQDNDLLHDLLALYGKIEKAVYELGGYDEDPEV